MPRSHHNARTRWNYPTIYAAPEPAPETAPRQESSAGPCPFRCNSQWRRATTKYEKAIELWEAGRGPRPDPVEIEPRDGQPVYCLRCVPVIRAALRELPLAYDAIGPGTAAAATRDDEHVTRSAALPSPSPAADHQDEIASLMRDWEDILRRELRHAAATDVFGDRRATLANSVDYLNTYYRQIITWIDGTAIIASDFGGDVWRLHSAAVRMVKSGTMRRRLPVPCPTCEAMALIQEEGAALEPWSIECVERAGGCGRIFNENEYAWLRELLLDRAKAKAKVAA